MEYTPGKVYRSTNREAQRYRARAERREMLAGALFAVFSLAAAIASMVLFVEWWLV